MSEEKKNISTNHQIRDDELDMVSGGYNRLEYFARGNAKERRTCWQCGHDFGYAPGVNMGRGDPLRNFCSPECKKKYENKYMIQAGDPRG